VIHFFIVEKKISLKYAVLYQTKIISPQVQISHDPLEGTVGASGPGSNLVTISGGIVNLEKDVNNI
jgi:hypothetical protein